MQTYKRDVSILPDHSRVLLRHFSVTGDATDPVFQVEDLGRSSRTSKIVQRVLGLSDQQVDRVLQKVLDEFRDRHRNIGKIFLRRFENVESLVPQDVTVSEKRRMLIGSYFLAEYSLESAALFNPSIVPHPDQTGLKEGELRFILSLRAVGEGHISSIEFRSGVIGTNGNIHIDPPTRYVAEPEYLRDTAIDKKRFERKLSGLGIHTEFSRSVLGGLDPTFTLDTLRKDIEGALRRQSQQADAGKPEHEARVIFALARSNYDVRFPGDMPISERVLFPSAPSESNGIEDARFVMLTDDAGKIRYYATYTAYDGKSIIPKLLETDDFIHFRFRTMSGAAVRNKGTALFPKKLDGRYVMLSRQDGENLSIMYSDEVEFWNESRIIMEPEYEWEFIQIGNCGSPVETDEGWLVLSHGVGSVRKYCIGAFLLDWQDPSKVLARTRRPIIIPEGEEREGYVPNVVYTCGMLLHGGRLVIPYAMSDYATGFITVPVEKVFDVMD
jgi:predicted GH43/DUF377 family glycosyl hydrolase